MKKNVRYGWNGILLVQEICLIVYLLMPIRNLQFALAGLAFGGFVMGGWLWKPGIRIAGVIVRIGIGVIVTLISAYESPDLGFYMTGMALVSLACLFDFWMEYRQRTELAIRVINELVRRHFERSRLRLSDETP